MRSFDYSGTVMSKTNHFRTADGRSAPQNTQNNTLNEPPTFRNVTILEWNGKVTNTNVVTVRCAVNQP